MGYPLTGQTTENSLPTTARSSPSGWTWGGPRRRKKEWLLKGIIIFLLWDSAGSNQAENAFTIDIQSGRMCCWSSPIGSLALVEATVLNRDLTYVDVADDFAMHRDILTDEQPAKQSVYNTAKNSSLCMMRFDKDWNLGQGGISKTRKSNTNFPFYVLLLLLKLFLEMALHFLYFLSSSSFSRSFSKKSYFYTYFGPCPSILDPFFAKITKEKASAGAKAIYSFGQLLPLAKATERQSNLSISSFRFEWPFTYQ